MMRALFGMHAVHQGLWLGLLEGTELQAVTAHYYAASRQYTGAAHNTSGLLGWETALVERHFAGCRTVLVGAAGGGREVVALARRGIAVDAFECSPVLLATAERVLREEGLTARVRLAPPDTLPDGLGTYDGVILGWGAYTHVAGRQARVRLLRDLAGHLRSGGPLLFSFQTRTSHAAAQRTFRWVYGVARAVRAARRSRAPLELGDVLPGYFAHRFTGAEVEAEAGAAGLLVEQRLEWEYGAILARVGPTAGGSA
jgi:2-polyprenyl-3-methyl-5-hydroxy-6-metoxy-1,4-benzoquinol methylase